MQQLQVILNRSDMSGFKKIVAGPMRRLSCVPKDTLTLTIEEETLSGYRLAARKGRMEQQVFVTVDGTVRSGELAPKNKLRDALDEALGENDGVLDQPASSSVVAFSDKELLEHSQEKNLATADALEAERTHMPAATAAREQKAAEKSKQKKAEKEAKDAAAKANLRWRPSSHG